MESGKFVQFPRSGGALDQSQYLIEAIRMAHRVWWINAYLPAANKPPSTHDQEFMEWLLEGWKPSASVYQADSGVVERVKASM